MFISKKKNALLRNLKLQINNTGITPQSSVELLGVTIENELKFDQHIRRLSKSIWNALFRLKSYLNFEQKKVLIKKFIYANFNYCPLVWHYFCTYKSMNQIERIQKRALQLLCNDLESNYSQLLDKAKENTMSTVRLRCLCRSSPSEVLLGKGVLKICIKFTGERPCRSAISIKLL